MQRIVLIEMIRRPDVKDFSPLIAIATDLRMRMFDLRPYLCVAKVGGQPECGVVRSDTRNTSRKVAYRRFLFSFGR